MIEETIRSILLKEFENVYIGDAPIDIDECQFLKSISGVTTKYFEEGSYDRPTYIVYTRSLQNKKAKEDIDIAYSLLNRYKGSGFVLYAYRLPKYVGRDSKHRALYSFEVEYQLSNFGG